MGVILSDLAVWAGNVNGLRKGVASPRPGNRRPDVNDGVRSFFATSRDRRKRAANGVSGGGQSLHSPRWGARVVRPGRATRSPDEDHTVYATAPYAPNPAGRPKSPDRGLLTPLYRRC